MLLVDLLSRRQVSHLVARTQKTTQSHNVKWNKQHVHLAHSPSMNPSLLHLPSPSSHWMHHHVSFRIEERSRSRSTIPHPPTRTHRWYTVGVCEASHTFRFVPQSPHTHTGFDVACENKRTCFFCCLSTFSSLLLALVRTEQGSLYTLFSYADTRTRTHSLSQTQAPLSLRRPRYLPSYFYRREHADAF